MKLNNEIKSLELNPAFIRLNSDEETNQINNKNSKK